MSIYGRAYDDFWRVFSIVHPEISLSKVLYEICIDFWDDVYDEHKTFLENMCAAEEYLKKHINDYE